MNIVTKIFIIIYLLMLVGYFFSETSNNPKRRAINKVILASMFMIFGLVNYIIHYDISYHLIMLVAIILASIGDIVIMKSFTKGGCFFIISNILFFIYEWFLINAHNVQFYNIWWFIILFIIIFGGFVAFVLLKKINMKEKTIPVLIYLLTVTLHGTLGFSLARYFNQYDLSVFGLGLFLFMISDYFLMFHKFKYNYKKWILRCNSAFYFIGLLLVVISITL